VPTVFISYRRDDASANAGRLFDWLGRQFGRGCVFLDTDTIAPGDDFPRVLEERLAASDVLLAVIGPRWLAIADDRGRRLDQPDDYVRREIATALARGTRVIPVLVGGARVPRAEELPGPLQPLATRNATTIDDAKFERDFDMLVDVILDRPRGFARRQLDRLQRMLYVAKATSVVAPMLAIAAVLAVWMQVLDVFLLHTKAASYLLWVADAVSGAAPEPPVLIAAIDEATEKKRGRPFGPSAEWRRDHARLIDRAAAAGAAAVVFDLFFENDTAGDGELAEAARRARIDPHRTRVVFGARRAKNGRPVLVPRLHDAGDWGTVCISRRVGYTFAAPLAVMRGNDAATPGGRVAGDLVSADTPGLALAAVHAGRLQEIDVSRRQVRLEGPQRGEPPRYSMVERIRSSADDCKTLGLDDEVATLLIRLSPPGYWRDPARRASYAEMVDPTAVPDERLRGRIVLVGAALGGRDIHNVVRGFSYAQVYGVELHADAIANLATGRVIAMPTVDLQAAIMLFMAAAGAAASFFTATLSRAQRNASLAGAMAAYGLVAVVLAAQDFLLNVLYDLGAFFAAHALLRRLQSRLLGASREEVSP
jgi:CHASE2 domain-containing sensor protein